MPELSLSLCGRVSVAGNVVQPAASALSAKSLALLAYLALEPGPHRRDELAALLWGDYPDAKAKASLRQALVHLREAIPTAIRVTRASVELSSDVDCDVSTFVRLSKESPRTAAEFSAAGFLNGLHLRHCPAFDEWADAMRASLTRRLAEVLSAVTREALATRAWRDAVRFADRWVAAAPLSGAAVTASMEAHFMGGDRERALETFAAYRTRLAEDSGESPALALVELADRIRAAARSTAPRHATEEWYAAAPAFEGSLVGREREWESLTRSWAKAATGQGRVALIEGDVGVGRTRLAGDFLRWVTAQGGTVLHGRGYDARGGAPFGAMTGALRSSVNAPGLAGTDPQWLAEVARVVPELRKRFPALGVTAATTVADGWRLLEGVAQMLSALAEEAPVIVLIDDLQWCDADSCAMLHALVRQLGA